MFCPKCGVETAEGHKFCKSCGTNLQIVSDAIKGGDDTLGQLRLDLDGLKRTFSESGKAIADEARRAVKTARSGRYRGRPRTGWGDWRGWEHYQREESKGAVTKEANTALTTDELTAAGPGGLPRGLPRPKEWLRYSKQRNIRDGLVSLLGGVGLGAFLFYMGRVIMDSGAINGIAESSHVHDLDKLLIAVIPLLWLVALGPVLKGLGQLFYGLFFAESISKIAAAFGGALRPSVPAPGQINMPPAQVAQPWTDPAGRSEKADKVRAGKDKAADYVTGTVPSPPSVTENTTNILEKA
jgi:hypothetical protein